MRPDREMAVSAFQNMGWTATRKKNGKTPVWEFKRPDTGGLWDVFTVRQDVLSMSVVADKAMQYGDAIELQKDIAAVKEEWLRNRFLGLFTTSKEQA